MRNKILLLVAILGVSLLLVGAMYWTSLLLLRSKNNFIRLFPPALLGSRQAIALNTNAFTIIGKQQDTLYLGNRLSPKSCIKVAMPTMDTLHQTFDWMPQDSLPFYWNLQLRDSQLAATNTLNGHLLLSSFPYRSMRHVQQFTQPLHVSIPLSATSFVAKYFDSKKNARSIGKYLMGSEQPTLSYLPWKQDEGIFSTDGHLVLNEKWKQFLYIHHYTNQIEALDTNLSKLITSSTIDLEDSITGKVISAKTSNSIVQRLEGSIVNQLATTHNDYLLVLSKQMAKNQSLSQFNTHSTLDVYRLPSLSYDFSFLIPVPKRKRIQDLVLDNNELFLLIDQELVKYRLFFPIRP